MTAGFGITVFGNFAVRYVRFIIVGLAMSLVVVAPATVHAGELKLASIFSSHMILQQGIPAAVWGWAGAGKNVKVSFAGQTKTATADAAGRWMVKLDSLQTSADSRELLVEAGKDSLTLADVLVGEVWLASGQSNMSLTVGECRDAAREIATADHPQLRLFNVGGASSLKPLDTIGGQWAACSPQSVARFSAAGYYFGRELQQILNVPVGVINSSMGGSPAEAWTRLEALKTIPRLGERAAKEITLLVSKPEDDKRYDADLLTWRTKNHILTPPLADIAKGWADPSLSTTDWETISLPGSWGRAGFRSGGVFWIRKDINVPDAVAGKALGVSLEVMDDDDSNTAYWNGIEIGKGNNRYSVPANLVTAGRNVLAIRIASATEKSWGRKIAVTVPGQTAPDDKWLVKQENAFAPLSAEAMAARPTPNRSQIRFVSATQYNGMIHALIPFAIKGVIWYQGEGNSSRTSEYPELLTLLIEDWRKQWGVGDFAFLIQQLVNIGEPSKDPNHTGTWPFVREAQMQIANTVPNCGIAIGIDIGEVATVHPVNKQDVGKRLALVALEKTYGKKIESSGPRYASMKVEGGAIRVTLTHAAGLQARGGELKRFAIAGADKKFVWADAKIDAGIIIVASPQVPQPVAVRYAWTQNPQGCNLSNDAGLPAAPFRTDAW